MFSDPDQTVDMLNNEQQLSVTTQIQSNPSTESAAEHGGNVTDLDVDDDDDLMFEQFGNPFDSLQLPTHNNNNNNENNNSNTSSIIHKQPTTTTAVAVSETSITNTEIQLLAPPNDGGINRVPTLIPTNEEIYSEDLPLPYKKHRFHSYIYYLFETWLITNPRVYAIYLLVRMTLPRALVLFDMWTDSVVALNFFNNGNTLYFALTLIFITTPFLLVWVASLRVVRSKLTKQKKTSVLVNIGLFLYIFPPIGSIVMFLVEVLMIFSDIYHAFVSFILGTAFIESNDATYVAIKSYRRAIEIFGESIPQTLLQISIVLFAFDDLNVEKKDENDFFFDLYLSIATSMINLIINFIRFRKEAKWHGMRLSEYALSVLQLAEIPITKLVPRLPAISKGKVETVNFSGFKFDRESFGPLLNALASQECHLRNLKLSFGSLAKLDNESCKMLGRIFKDANVNLIVSKSVDSYHIKTLFEQIDEDKNGYLDEDEFLNAVSDVNTSMSGLNDKQKKR